MGRLRPWVACVRVNRHDKAYFLHQLDGFSQIVPHLVTWDDARPDAERRAMAQNTTALEAPWQSYWRFPGGHRLLTMVRRVRGKLMRRPLSPGAAERGALRRLAQDVPPDVIYAHTGFVGLRLLPLAQRLGVPLVVHFHGLDLNTPDPVYLRQLRHDVQHFDRIIVVGEWMVPPLVAMGYDSARIALVPMGAPMAHVQAKTDSVKRDPGRTGIRFIAVGHMIPYKGFDRTLAAFAQLAARHNDVELVLVGDGSERAALEQAAQSAGVAGAVRFTGTLSSDATLGEMAQADVLLHHPVDHPGGPEAFGVVITEGMALGLPVVGSRCGGLPDQIIDTETGFLVDQDDVAGMADAMARLAEDASLRATLGTAGQARAKSAFDAHVLARQAEDVLLQAAGKGTQP